MAIQLSHHRFTVDDYHVVWLVDLIRDEVEVFRGPSPSGFRQVERRGRRATVEPAAFPDLSLAIDELLGPAQ